MIKVQSSLCFLAITGMLSLGCSNNKAATPEASSSQPSSSAPAAASNTNTNPDQKFVEDAAKGNRAEVELGKIVAAKAANPGKTICSKNGKGPHTSPESVTAARAI